MTILLAFSVSFGFILPINAHKIWCVWVRIPSRHASLPVWTVPDGDRLPVVATVCRHLVEILGLM